MKFVSALILVCAFACASAQYGVKGGSYGSSSGSRGGSFYPRFRPTSSVKAPLQSPNVYGGPSVIVDDSTGLVTGNRVGGGNGITSGGVVGQPDVQSGPFGYLYWCLLTGICGYGSPTSNGAASGYGPSTLQSVPSYTSTGYGSGAFSPVSVGKVGRRQYSAPQAIVSRPALQEIVSRPAPQVVVSRPAPLEIISRPVPQEIISRPAPQVVVSRPAPLQTPPSYSFNSPPSYKYDTPPSYNYNTSPVRLSYPQLSSQSASLPVTRQVPTLTQGYTSVSTQQGQRYNPTVPSLSSSVLSAPSLPATTTTTTSLNVAPTVGSGEIFTDNKISSPGFSGLQTPSIISQEKQFADTVQTTEW